MPIPRAFRWSRWSTGFALLWLVLQPVVFHRKSLINPTTYIPHDLPGFHVPLGHAVVDALLEHRLPLWDPYTYGGYPLHANLQAQILYPPAWPVFAAAVLGRPESLFYWLEWETVLHISLAGLLTWWLLRRAGCARWPALFGATVYQLGFFFTSQVQHLGAVCAAAWLPLVWLAVMELARGFSRTWFAALAASLAFTFLAGFMAMTIVAYGSAFVVAFGLWLSRRAPGAAILWTGLGILASIPLIAAQLVPTALWTVDSQASLRWQWNLIDGVPPEALLSALWPNWFHVFQPEHYTGRFNITWLYLYSGQAALWLLLAAPWLRTKLPARLFAGLGALFVVAMFGDFTPGYASLFRMLPHALQGAIYPHFAEAALSLCVAIAAALALEHVASGRGTAVAAAIALGTSLELLAAGANRPMNAAQGDWKMIDSPAVWFQRRTILPQLRSWVNPTTPPQRTDSVQDDYRFTANAPSIRIPSLSGDDPFVPLRLLEYRKLFGQGPEWVRVYPVSDPASPLLLCANVGFLLHYGDAEAPAGWDEVDWKPGPPVHVFHNGRVMPRYYLVSQVRAAVSADAAASLLKQIDVRRAAVVEGAVECCLPGVADPPRVDVVSYRADRVVLRTTVRAPAFLVAAEGWAPGWRARVNGRATQLYPANLAFQGLLLSPGSQEIVLEYVPTVAYAALWVSIAAWLSLCYAVGSRPAKIGRNSVT